MSNIKLIVDNREIKLTKDDIKKIGIFIENQRFNRTRLLGEYFFIDKAGKVYQTTDHYYIDDNSLYNVGNYCTDGDFMRNRAKQETLNRLLWRFSMCNGWDDKFLYDATAMKFYIRNSCFDSEYTIGSVLTSYSQGIVYFKSEEIARRAINEIIIPFESGELFNGK